MNGEIINVKGYEFLDSRGNPTVYAEVKLADGSCGAAFSPSGASTGRYEALELRDGDASRYNGKGVLSAVRNINERIAPALAAGGVCDQRTLDEAMIDLDGTEDKSALGANAVLAVSLAGARAFAKSQGLPLFGYIGGISGERLPVPMMNILNGGAHSSNNIDIQEFMIVPTGCPSFKEALRTGAEIYHALGSILKSEGLSAGVGDEGGFAPDLKSDEQAIEYILKAVEKAGFDDSNVKLALDIASGEWYDNGTYHLPKRNVTMDYEELISHIENLVDTYPIISVEDGLGDDDAEGWKELTERLGDRIMLVGDDLFVTNIKRLKEGVNQGAANSILIKLNQIGTLSETLDVIRYAKSKGYTPIVSHRSGETEDSFIADLSVGMNCPFIKSGAPCRTDRVAKYNRLLRIESYLKN